MWKYLFNMLNLNCNRVENNLCRMSLVFFFCQISHPFLDNMDQIQISSLTIYCHVRNLLKRRNANHANICNNCVIYMSNTKNWGAKPDLDNITLIKKKTWSLAHLEYSVIKFIMFFKFKHFVLQKHSLKILILLLPCQVRRLTLSLLSPLPVLRGHPHMWICATDSLPSPTGEL